MSSDYDTFAGTITAQGNGNATITVTATINSETVLTAKLTVHVSLPTPPAEPTISFDGNHTLEIGESENVNVTLSNFDSDTMSLSFESSSESIFTVGEYNDGVVTVTAVGAGNGTLTGAIVDKTASETITSATATITVESPAPVLTPTITFTSDAVNIPSIGSSEYLDFTKTNFDSETMEIMPDVSPSGVITIEAEQSYDSYFKARGVTEGTATVTARILDKSNGTQLAYDTCTVTVGTPAE